MYVICFLETRADWWGWQIRDWQIREVHCTLVSSASRSPMVAVMRFKQILHGSCQEVQ